MRKPRPAWAIAPASDRRRLAVRLPLNPSRRMDGNLHPRLILIDIVRASIDTDPPASPLQALELRRWALARFSCPGATAELEAAETLGAVTLSTWSLFQATERCALSLADSPDRPIQALPEEIQRRVRSAATAELKRILAGLPGLARLNPLEHAWSILVHITVDHTYRRGRIRDSLLLATLSSCPSNNRADLERRDASYAAPISNEMTAAASAADGARLMTPEGYPRAPLQRSVSTLQLSPASPSRRPDTKRCRRRPLRSPSGSRFQNVAPPRSSAGT